VDGYLAIFLLLLRNSSRILVFVLVLFASTGVRRGVSRGEEDGRRLPALWVGHPFNDR
jgi:hypothetical protein